MPSNDKKKQIQKRLSKLKKIKRKDKKKKRTKHKGSKSNNLYQEYAYQRKSRRASYLLVLFIILLLVAVGVIVYFFVIIPKLDKNKKPECNKNEIEDCQKNEYLEKNKCECSPCEVPNPGCGPNEYYDPNNIPYCRNSTKYTTDKDGNKKKMYSCQPCPTCPDGKKVNQCGGGEYDINNASNNNKSCVRIVTPDNDNKKDGLSFNTILLIISGCLVLVMIIMYSIPAIYHYRYHRGKISKLKFNDKNQLDYLNINNTNNNINNNNI